MWLRDTLLDRLFLPESYTKAKKTDLYDFVMANGFGRNTYTDTEITTVVRLKRDELGSDIATFEWLYSENFDPGGPNDFLAFESMERSGFFSIPVIGQWEIMYALWKKVPSVYSVHIDSLVTIWPPKGGHLGTRGFILEVKRLSDKLGLRMPLVLAHPEHIQRCFFLTRKIFSSAKTEKNTVTYELLWFNKWSVQKWTRGKMRWLFYELFTRIHHRILGWM